MFSLIKIAMLKNPTWFSFNSNFFYSITAPRKPFLYPILTNGSILCCLWKCFMGTEPILVYSNPNALKWSRNHPKRNRVSRTLTVSIFTHNFFLHLQHTDTTNNFWCLVFIYKSVCKLDWLYIIFYFMISSQMTIH